ncbi:LysR substrate-binding domain-containing protein [Embleya sp. NBC_00896]|uniref:LysR family transcriptional regulator n=1 Tax=Embleya sp. NBC_00896 TaxID=2975961 RepID=UPI0038633D07|nr:LysR family transcriptional regulator [Embleya sp. NBC_00896]
MTLQQLRYLIAVAEHGSMTGAAQELFVVQPALSRSLQSLERELNVTLFTRVGRGLVLTAAGIQVVNLARKVIRGVQGIRDIVRVDDSAHTGTVRLATTATLAIEFTSGLLPGLAKLHPELAIVIDRHDSREALFASLRAGRADIALVDLPAPGGFEVLPLRTYEVVLVSPKGVRIPDPVSWTELDGLPMILPTRGSGRRADIEMLFATAGVRPIVAMETDERGAWISCVVAGHGSLLWYADLAQPFAESVSVRSMSPRLIRSVGLVRGRVPITREVRALLDYTRRHGVQECEYV